jgi:hypothetical protein
LGWCQLSSQVPSTLANLRTRRRLCRCCTRVASSPHHTGNSAGDIAAFTGLDHLLPTHARTDPNAYPHSAYASGTGYSAQPHCAETTAGGDYEIVQGYAVEGGGAGAAAAVPVVFATPVGDLHVSSQGGAGSAQQRPPAYADDGRGG